jgi:hypothetical protein
LVKLTVPVDELIAFVFDKIGTVVDNNRGLVVEIISVEYTNLIKIIIIIIFIFIF